MARASDTHAVRVGAVKPSVPDSPFTARLVLDDRGETAAVGPYRVTRTLGHGGMGVVYEVVDEAGVNLALKIIEMRYIESGDGSAGRRFSQEVAVLSQLEHPGIVRFYGYGYARHPEGTELGFFLMERLVGKTLEELIIAQRRFTPMEAVEVIGLLAQALQYLEDSDVLHRDIKPSNLFLEQGGRTVLMDFGLARSEELTRLTRAGQVIGTVSYMAPERLCGMPSDISSDVYSLGVVLFEMLTGKLPFVSTDPTELVREIRTGIEWPATATMMDGAEVQALVRSMLSSEARARPRPRDIIKRLLSIRSEGTIAEATISDDKTMAVTFRLAPQGFEATERDTKPTPPLPQNVADARPAPTTNHRSGPVDPRGPTTSEPRPLIPPESASGIAPRFATHNGPSWAVAAAFSVLTFFGGLLTGVVGTSPVEETAAAPPPVAPPPAKPPKPGAAQLEVRTFEDAETAYRYGDRALDAGNTAEGVRALRRAIELNITHADAYKRLGHGLLTLGEATEAAEKLDMYLKLRPGAKDAADVKKLLAALRPQ